MSRLDQAVRVLAGLPPPRRAPEGFYVHTAKRAVYYTLSLAIPWQTSSGWLFVRERWLWPWRRGANPFLRTLRSRKTAGRSAAWTPVVRVTLRYTLWHSLSRELPRVVQELLGRGAPAPAGPGTGGRRWA